MSPDERFALADGRVPVPGEGGGPIERAIPEERRLPPIVDRPAPFPIKKRLIEIVAFAGPLGTVDGVTGEVTGAGLIVNVRAWLDVSDEKDILDWELSVDPLTGDGRFIILYTE
ncbi:hypothetical protein LCGC14_1408120 [marine sediment metagenome]|uniref:Uncharacterized protein n=1 Tax=marine sediment metagenome TaxID=412755 RepID=A0A0F9MWQ0_9ZZZZ